MNIDLLLTSKGEPGLICDGPFDAPAVAVIFDLQERQLYVEMEESDSLPLNISISEEFIEDLTYSDIIGIGVIVEEEITESLQVPVITLEEGDFRPSLKNMSGGRTSSVVYFERFLKSCSKGQPIHRDDLGNEASINTVMQATQMMAPQFSPKLEHQRRLEAGPRTPGPVNAPQFSGPGGGASGGGGGGSNYRRIPAANRENKNNQDE